MIQEIVEGSKHATEWADVSVALQKLKRITQDPSKVSQPDLQAIAQFLARIVSVHFPTGISLQSIHIVSQLLLSSSRRAHHHATDRLQAPAVLSPSPPSSPSPPIGETEGAAAAAHAKVNEALVDVDGLPATSISATGKYSDSAKEGAIDNDPNPTNSTNPDPPLLIHRACDDPSRACDDPSRACDDPSQDQAQRDHDTRTEVPESALAQDGLQDNVQIGDAPQALAFPQWDPSKPFETSDELSAADSARLSPEEQRTLETFFVLLPFLDTLYAHKASTAVTQTLHALFRDLLALRSLPLTLAVTILLLGGHTQEHPNPWLLAELPSSPAATEAAALSPKSLATSSLSPPPLLASPTVLKRLTSQLWFLVASDVSKRLPALLVLTTLLTHDAEISLPPLSEILDLIGSMKDGPVDVKQALLSLLLTRPNLLPAKDLLLITAHILVYWRPSSPALVTRTVSLLTLAHTQTHTQALPGSSADEGSSADVPDDRSDSTNVFAAVRKLALQLARSYPDRLTLPLLAQLFPDVECLTTMPLSKVRLHAQLGPGPETGDGDSGQGSAKASADDEAILVWLVTQVLLSLFQSGTGHSIDLSHDLIVHYFGDQGTFLDLFWSVGEPAPARRQRLALNLISVLDSEAKTFLQRRVALHRLLNGGGKNEGSKMVGASIASVERELDDSFNLLGGHGAMTKSERRMLLCMEWRKVMKRLGALVDYVEAGGDLTQDLLARERYNAQKKAFLQLFRLKRRAETDDKGLGDEPSAVEEREAYFYCILAFASVPLPFSTELPQLSLEAGAASAVDGPLQTAAESERAEEIVVAIAKEAVASLFANESFGSLLPRTQASLALRRLINNRSPDQLGIILQCLSLSAEETIAACNLLYLIGLISDREYSNLKRDLAARYMASLAAESIGSPPNGEKTVAVPPANSVPLTCHAARSLVASLWEARDWKSVESFLMTASLPPLTLGPGQDPSSKRIVSDVVMKTFWRMDANIPKLVQTLVSLWQEELMEAAGEEVEKAKTREVSEADRERQLSMLHSALTSLDASCACIPNGHDRVDDPGFGQDSNHGAVFSSEWRSRETTVKLVHMLADSLTLHIATLARLAREGKAETLPRFTQIEAVCAQTCRCLVALFVQGMPLVCAPERDAEGAISIEDSTSSWTLFQKDCRALIQSQLQLWLRQSVTVSHWVFEAVVLLSRSLISDSTEGLLPTNDAKAKEMAADMKNVLSGLLAAVPLLKRAKAREFRTDGGIFFQSRAFANYADFDAIESTLLVAAADLIAQLSASASSTKDADADFVGGCPGSVERTVATFLILALFGTPEAHRGIVSNSSEQSKTPGMERHGRQVTIASKVLCAASHHGLCCGVCEAKARFIREISNLKHYVLIRSLATLYVYPEPNPYRENNDEKRFERCDHVSGASCLRNTSLLSSLSVRAMLESGIDSLSTSDLASSSPASPTTATRDWSAARDMLALIADAFSLDGVRAVHIPATAVNSTDSLWPWEDRLLVAQKLLAALGKGICLKDGESAKGRIDNALTKESTLYQAETLTIIMKLLPVLGDLVLASDTSSSTHSSLGEHKIRSEELQSPMKKVIDRLATLYVRVTETSSAEKTVNPGTSGRSFRDFTRFSLANHKWSLEVPCKTMQTGSEEPPAALDESGDAKFGDGRRDEDRLKVLQIAEESADLLLPLEELILIYFSIEIDPSRIGMDLCFCLLENDRFCTQFISSFASGSGADHKGSPNPNAGLRRLTLLLAMTQAALLTQATAFLAKVSALTQQRKVLVALQQPGNKVWDEDDKRCVEGLRHRRRLWTDTFALTLVAQELRNANIFLKRSMDRSFSHRRVLDDRGGSWRGDLGDRVSGRDFWDIGLEEEWDCDRGLKDGDRGSGLGERRSRLGEFALWNDGTERRDLSPFLEGVASSNSVDESMKPWRHSTLDIHKRLPNHPQQAPGLFEGLFQSQAARAAAHVAFLRAFVPVVLLSDEIATPRLDVILEIVAKSAQVTLGGTSPPQAATPTSSLRQKDSSPGPALVVRGEREKVRALTLLCVAAYLRKRLVCRRSRQRRSVALPFADRAQDGAHRGDFSARWHRMEPSLMVMTHGLLVDPKTLSHDRLRFFDFLAFLDYTHIAIAAQILHQHVAEESIAAVTEGSTEKGTDMGTEIRAGESEKYLLLYGRLSTLTREDLLKRINSRDSCYEVEEACVSRPLELTETPVPAMSRRERTRRALEDELNIV